MKERAIIIASAILMMLQIDVRAVRAETLWTNTAQAPSHIRYRGLDAAYSLMKKFPIDGCAIEVLSRRAVSGDGALPLYMNANIIYDALGREYYTTFPMSFYRDGKDYVDLNTKLAIEEPATGKLFFHQCNGKAYYLGYAPKCQNLFLLTYKGETFVDRDEDDHFMRYVDQLLFREYHRISAPGAFWLFVFGAAIMGMMINHKKH